MMGIIKQGSVVYCSWSGGKDCAQALHEAVRRGAQPGLLVTVMTEGGERSRTHGLHRGLLQCQADTIGVPILFGSATWNGYATVFRELDRKSVV
jgi:Predicted ATPases of PP-loop superfamily